MPYDPYRNIEGKKFRKYMKSPRRKKRQSYKKFSNEYYTNFNDHGDWIAGSAIDKKFKKQYGRKV